MCIIISIICIIKVLIFKKEVADVIVEKKGSDPNIETEVQQKESQQMHCKTNLFWFFISIPSNMNYKVQGIFINTVCIKLCY